MSDKLNKILQNNIVNWVFFDFFDTLILRRCHPDEIKMQWANLVSEELQFQISSLDIYKIRISAEKRLSEKFNGLVKMECKYKDLCKEIFLRLCIIKEKIIFKLWENDNDFYDFSYKAEVNIEIINQYINEKTVKKMCALKRQGYYIGIISDFYLPLDAFIKFVDYFELSNYIDKIYVSSEVGIRKESGDLYAYVLSDIFEKANECIMIGDNYHSDYLVPKKLGFNCLWIKKENSIKLMNEKNIENRLNMLSNRSKKNTYNNYAFSLYLFISELYKNLVKDEIGKVTFLAREGQFLKELFELYLEINKANEIESQYAYVSRLSTFVPGLKCIKEEKFENLFYQYKDLSIYSFLFSVGFEKEDITQLSLLFKKDYKKIIINFSTSSEFEELKSNIEFCKTYNKVRKKQKENFQIYFKDFLIEKCNKPAISVVDVGWKGTIQDNIFNFYKGQMEISGYYLGINNCRNIDSYNRKKGLLFSEYPFHSNGFDLWSYDKSFYEKILYASHASTRGYTVKNDKVQPQLENYNSEEETYQFLRSYQIELINIFIKINDIFKNTCYSPSDLEPVFRKIHLQTICTNNKKTFQMQKYLIEKHYQNFGEVSWSQNQIIQQIRNIFRFNKKNILKKILKEGLSIKYLYPGIKILNKMHLNFFSGIYGKMVYIYEKSRIGK